MLTFALHRKSEIPRSQYLNMDLHVDVHTMYIMLAVLLISNVTRMQPTSSPMLASAPQAVVEAFDALAQRQSSGVAYFAERAETSKTNADTLLFATAIIRYAPKLFDTMQAVHPIETTIMLTEERQIAIIARWLIDSEAIDANARVTAQNTLSGLKDANLISVSTPRSAAVIGLR